VAASPVSGCFGRPLDAGELGLTLHRGTAVLALEGDLVELGDLPLPLEARGVVGPQRFDQRLDPVADLEGEVRRRRSDQLADVLDGRLALEALGVLEFAHARANGIRATCPTAGRPGSAR